MRLSAIILSLLLGGCSHFTSKTAPNILAEQTPGVVEGGGAKLTSPGNAAAPTTMVAEKRTAFYPPASREPVPRYESPKNGQETPVITPVIQPVISPPDPVWIDEKVTTTIGAHQDAAAIVKVAAQANTWSKVRWLGICLVVVALLAALYYRGTPDGYPLIYMKVGAIGLGLAIVDPSPWWILLLLIPAGFYVAQKFNLLRIPLP